MKTTREVRTIFKNAAWHLGVRNGVLYTNKLGKKTSETRQISFYFCGGFNKVQEMQDLLSRIKKDGVDDAWITVSYKTHSAHIHAFASYYPKEIKGQFLTSSWGSVSFIHTTKARRQCA